MIKKILKKRKINAVKKSVKKKRKTEMPVVEGNKCFWVNGGPVLCNIKDLEDALKNMTDEQYSYHADSTKNDFSNWIEFVLIDKKCARDLRKCKARTQALACVRVAMRKYR